MEEQIKCTWIGPNGVNSLLGTVSAGMEFELSDSEFEYFKFRGLVKKKGSKSEGIIKETKKKFTRNLKK